MAKVLEGFEFHGKGRRVSAYAKYLDGQVWEIDCKKDHPGCGSSLSVLASINATARKRGMRVRSDGVRNEGILVVQAYKPE